MIDLENQWLRVSILPEIGGKIWTRGRQGDREVVHLRQSGGQVPRHRDARAVDQWRDRGQLRHHRSHAQLSPHQWTTSRSGTLMAASPAPSERSRPADPYSVAAGDHAPGRQGLLHHFAALAQWQTPFEQPYYSWMNTAIPVGDDLEFIYPGDSLPRPWRRGRVTGRSTRRKRQVRPLLLPQQRLRRLQVVSRLRQLHPTSSAPTGTTRNSGWRATRRTMRSRGRSSGSGVCRGRG